MREEGCTKTASNGTNRQAAGSAPSKRRPTGRQVVLDHCTAICRAFRPGANPPRPSVTYTLQQQALLTFRLSWIRLSLLSSVLKRPSISSSDRRNSQILPAGEDEARWWTH